MCKTYYKIIFVVLVYRNTNDLKDFFESNNIPDSKTIVVNSFFDSESEAIFKEIAVLNNADFISVPNKGYGSGNNRGIEHALSNYDFDYLIVSNADVCIEKFDIDILKNYHDGIIAPKILTLNGKNQNPSSPFMPSIFREKIVNWIYKNNHKRLIYAYYAWSRLSKIVYYSISTIRKKIYSPHGAFFIMPYDILKRIAPIYNERMFLFFEEHHLGQLLKEKNIPVYYLPEIVIRHKEDGSVGFLSDSIFKLMRDSYMEYFNYWYK